MSNRIKVITYNFALPNTLVSTRRADKLIALYKVIEFCIDQFKMSALSCDMNFHPIQKYYGSALCSHY